MFTISINLTLCIGYACRADKNPYRHDRRADKNPYRHDRRADKNTYRHDRRADSQCLYTAEKVFVARLILKKKGTAKKIIKKNMKTSSF